VGGLERRTKERGAAGQDQKENKEDSQLSLERRKEKRGLSLSLLSLSPVPLCVRSNAVPLSTLPPTSLSVHLIGIRKRERERERKDILGVVVVGGNFCLFYSPTFVDI